MRYAILSDIHSNLVALRAVLQHMESAGPIDEVWCLGDTVGYGPAPNECTDLMRSYEHVGIAGNHDWAATGRLDTSEFNPDASDAALWTSRVLSDENRSYLETLPLTTVRGHFTMAHGSPRNPIWEYLLSERVAAASFEHFETTFCLVGHSHIPLLFHEDVQGNISFQRLPLDQAFRPGRGRWILNPGSVGQPRDGDPRASYVMYDASSGEFHQYRVSYDIEATQAEMLRLRLPQSLSERLSHGW